MAQQYAFFPYANTASATVTTGVTMTLGTSSTGLPATAARVWNNSAAPIFILFANATTATIGTTSGMPVPPATSGFAPVFRTGGNAYMIVATAATNTVFVTSGEGID